MLRSALALLVLLAAPPHMQQRGTTQRFSGADSMQTQSGAMQRSKLVFDAPLNASGLLSPAVPVPTISWRGEDPLGAGGLTSHTFSEVGTPTYLDAPFCTNGQFSLIDEGACSQAFHNEGGNNYLEHAGTIGNPASGDISFCALARQDDEASTQSDTFAGTTDSVTGDGWSLGYTSSPSNRCWVRFKGTGGIASAFSATITGHDIWNLCCGVATAAGNIQPYVNGYTTGTPVAYPGTVESDGDFYIGWAGGSSNKNRGDIAALDVWAGTALTPKQIQLYSAAMMGIQDNKATTAPLCQNVNHIGYWVDGKMEATQDNFCIVGWEYPPGSALAGQGECLQSIQQETNQILSSRNLSTNWTETGISVVSCSQTNTPFRSGRKTCKLTDDDGASNEYISQTMAWAGAATSSTMAVCLYAAADSAQTLDLQVDEATGGGCTPSTTDFPSVSIGTGWAQYEFVHTVADGDCTDFTFDIFPTDAATGSATGHAYVIAQVFQDRVACPPIYCETRTGVNTCGSNNVLYDAGNVVDGSGDLVGPHRFTSVWTPTQNFIDLLDYQWFLHDGTTNNRVQLNHLSDESIGVFSANGGSGAYILQSSPLTLVPGERTTFDVRLDYDDDIYKLHRNGLLISSDATARTSPTGVDFIQVGASHTAEQQSGAASLCEVRIYE